MQIKAEEISSIIKEKIKGFDQQVDVSQTGSVIQVGDGIAKIYGLDGAMAGEMLEFPGRPVRHRVEPRRRQCRRRVDG
jgi:F-type H+-transporting ATPase subunit alpha